VSDVGGDWLILPVQEIAEGGRHTRWHHESDVLRVIAPSTDAKRNMKAVLLGVTEFPPGDISADIKCRLNPVNAMVTTASSPAQRERPAGVWRRRILFRA
jgi:hypothetical protein